MKKITQIIGLLVMMIMSSSSFAQMINWAHQVPDSKHMLTASAGAEYGMVYGLGYGHQVHQGTLPIIANLDVSAPAGGHLVDDFKVRIGGQIRWIELGHFGLSTQLYGIFRRMENEYARILNFGSDFSGTIGYYRNKWYVSGVFGFDKAIVSDFKHSQAYRDQFPGVVDGWYEPTTGGNFYYGLEAGYSIGHCDLFVKAGKLAAQDWSTTPLLPYFGKIGVTVRL